MRHLNSLFFICCLLATNLCGCKPSADDGDDNTPEEIYHTVSFDTDGGSEITPIRVKHGGKIPVPEGIPTKLRRQFRDYYLYQGKVDFDTSLEYANGEKLPWWNTYLGEDSGPYIALSDLTFKVEWKKYTLNLRTTEQYSSSLFSSINNTSTSLDIEKQIEYLNFDGIDFFFNEFEQYSYAIQDDVFIFGSCYLENQADYDNLAYTGGIEYSFIGKKNYFATLREDEQNWIRSNFSDSIYNKVSSNNEVFGYPIMISNVLLRNQNTNANDIPAKYILFGFLNKYNIEHRPSNYGEKEEISRSFLQQLSINLNSL